MAESRKGVSARWAEIADNAEDLAIFRQTETKAPEGMSAALVSRRLSELEGVIERGLATFIEVGEALLEIRDSRLYRETYGTFEDYTLERWGLKRGRAYELMGASEVAGLVSEISDTTPARESHAAELAPLREEPEQMAEAWTEATERAKAENRSVTAQDVREAVEPRRPVEWERTKPEKEPCPTCMQWRRLGPISKRGMCLFPEWRLADALAAHGHDDLAEELERRRQAALEEES